MLGDDRPPLGRIEEAQVGLGGMPRSLLVDVLVDDGDRRIDADRLLGIDDLELAAGLVHLEVGFAFERDVHVAETLLRKRRRGGAGARIEHGGALVELGDERLGILLGATAGHHGTPGGEKTVFSVAARLRVGRDDRNVALHEVRPVLDALRIPLADDEDDDGVIGHRLVVVAVLPIGSHEPRLCDGLDIGPNGERDDVGIEAVDHGARLAPRGGVRLLDRHTPAVLSLIRLREGVVDLAV